MKHTNFQVVVCASGGGGNFQALIDGQKTSGYEIAALIVDRECGAIERAKNHDILCLFLNMKEIGKENFWKNFQKSIPPETNLIVLAGFMPIVPDYICSKWKGRIINTHPSLLPKYGGKGMVGVKVQEAVLENGDKEAGCTIHWVSPEIDGGDILLQSKVPVMAGESAWDLGGRIFIEENKLLVSAIRLIKDRQLHG